MVPLVAPSRLLIAQRLTLKVSARDIVEQELKLHPKPVSVLFQEVLTELLLVLLQHVQPPIKSRLVDSAQGYAQQILQHAVGIPALGHLQLAALAAEPCQCQNAGCQIPGHLFLAWLDEFPHQRVQPQPPPQRQAQIHLPKVAHPLDPYPAQIHLGPLRLRRGRQSLTQFSLNRRGGASLQQLSRLFPPRTGPALQARLLAQSRDDLLSRPFGGAHGLDQRPILVALTINGPAITAQEHGRHITAPPPAGTTGRSPLQAGRLSGSRNLEE